MKYTLQILCPPSPTAEIALKFCETLLDRGDEITRLFFFHEGVRNGDASAIHSLPQRWQRLIEAHNLDAVLCVSSAQQRGIGAAKDDLHPPRQGFVISGLGQLVDGCVHSDRVITFGGGECSL